MCVCVLHICILYWNEFSLLCMNVFMCACVCVCVFMWFIFHMLLVIIYLFESRWNEWTHYAVYAVCTSAIIVLTKSYEQSDIYARRNSRVVPIKSGSVAVIHITAPCSTPLAWVCIATAQSYQAFCTLWICEWCKYSAYAFTIHTCVLRNTEYTKKNT